MKFLSCTYGPHWHLFPYYDLQNWASAAISPEFSQHKMEANRGQGGIQQLLAAEQDAQHIVNAARNGKLSPLDYFHTLQIVGVW